MAIFRRRATKHSFLMTQALVSCCRRRAGRNTPLQQFEAMRIPDSVHALMMLFAPAVGEPNQQTIQSELKNGL